MDFSPNPEPASDPQGSSHRPRSWHLGATIGVANIAALLLFCLRGAPTNNWTDFSRLYYPCAKLASEHHMDACQSFYANAPQNIDHFTAIIARFVPSTVHYCDVPLVLSCLQILGHLPEHTALVSWNLLSLLALAASTYFVHASTKTLNTQEDQPSQAGLSCLAFAPVLLTLWLGQLGIVFGLLPLAAGYLLLIRKKPLLAGLVWSLLALKPAFLVVALVNCLVQSFNKRFSTTLALLGGTAVIGAAALITAQSETIEMWKTAFSNFSLQPGAREQLDISFLSSAMSFAPDRTGLVPVFGFVAAMIAVGGLMQLFDLAKTPGKEQQLVPFTTMLATLLVPIVLPHLPFCDLSVLTLGGLIAYCTEWREHLEFRVRTVCRLTWLFVNVYLIAFYFFPGQMHAALLVAALLMLYMRLAETVRFAAHTPNL
jgi:hypothetical protein